MFKKSYLLVVIALGFLLSAGTVLASQYTGRYSTIFDLNSDQVINLSDVSQVTNWLESGSHQNCYPFYEAKLTATSTDNTSYSSSDSWCSSLLGLVTDAMRTQTYNEIVDLNSDGKVNLSDVSLISTWYNSDYAQVCHYQFTKKYNHDDIHWCAAAYQGIIDSIGEASGGPDIGIDYIQMIPDMPVVNTPVEIKVQARNTGTINITNQAIINNVYKVLGGFTVTETIMPTVSSLDPIKPGETFDYRFKGTYSKKRNEFISFVYNPHDTDAELSFWNNSATKWITVNDTNLINIVEGKATNVTTNSALIYWKSSMGSNGEYRYAKDPSDLANLPWRTEGVSNNPDVTGNMFASQVSLTGLSANTKYFVQVRKYYQGASGPVYSADWIINFKTEFKAGDDSDGDLPAENNNEDKVKVCHVMGNNEMQTLTISQNALSAHLAQGDKPGACPTTKPSNPDLNTNNTFKERVRGRILLQVEKHGEAWYVNPKDDKRFYLKDGLTAYGLMRDAGLGISNNDLAKIPIGFEDRFNDIDTDSDGLADKLEQGLGTDPAKADTDSDGINDKVEILAGSNPLGSGALSTDNTLISKLRGKIVLQVQAHGEAWYINPVDGKRYYMKDGDAAYQIMRYLSLGITDTDLSKIPE